LIKDYGEDENYERKKRSWCESEALLRQLSTQVHQK
jgi:hypothetical protein